MDHYGTERYFKEHPDSELAKPCKNCPHRWGEHGPTGACLGQIVRELSGGGSIARGCDCPGLEGDS